MKGSNRPTFANARRRMQLTSAARRHRAAAAQSRENNIDVVQSATTESNDEEQEITISNTSVDDHHDASVNGTMTDDYEDDEESESSDSGPESSDEDEESSSSSGEEMDDEDAILDVNSSASQSDQISEEESKQLTNASSADDTASEFDKPLHVGKSNTGDDESIEPFGAATAHLPPPHPKSSNRELPTIPGGANRIGRSTSTGSAKDSHRGSLRSSPMGVPAMTTGAEDHLGAGMLPDYLMTFRQKLESLTMFDSDIMRFAGDDVADLESRDALKKSSQQSISAAVLVSLAHKRYERRRLAAMEIEKVIRGLVHQEEFERVRAILLLLSDDYVRSTSEDARKGGVVALAACAIGMKKVKDSRLPVVQECRDLILASVVHACQDHSQRVRYYACENLCNTVKVIPVLCIQHFFILFEILRSLYADVSVDVRKGAEILDRKMKEIVVNAMNSGALTAESCVPVFARFVYIRNKPTKRLTLTWLQELTEKLIGGPILEYLHLFLGGIFDMIADPTVAIRQSALAFLQSVLPKLVTLDQDTPMEENAGPALNMDKILQALVTTLEHPDPFVRKVAMYWMSRIVKSHIGGDEGENGDASSADDTAQSAAAISVRNSVPHVLPGILLSIGDMYEDNNQHINQKNSFLPDLTTRALAEQTNSVLQDAVRRGGSAYIPHLDAFIIALREELDSPGGMLGKNAPAVERSAYRMDVNHDGTGIESSGWFRGNNSNKDSVNKDEDMMVMSRLCALHWVIVLYRYVVPDLLKADYAREFIFAIINQLVDDPPKIIVYKSLEVLAKITVPVEGEDSKRLPGVGGSISSKFSSPSWASGLGGKDGIEEPQIPMTQSSIEYALGILEPEGRLGISRDREVFAALIEMHCSNQELLAYLGLVIAYMCKLQPSEFVMVSFSVELDRFVRKRQAALRVAQEENNDRGTIEFAQDLRFVSSFVQHMNHVLLTSEESQSVREILKDCVGSSGNLEKDRQRCRIFHILLHSFSHNLGSVLALCLWSGAFRTASLFLEQINPLDINIIFLLELDRLVEMLQRPLFRHVDILMLEHDKDSRISEGSGTMLFCALKSLLMILPQSTCYRVLRDRLTSISRFRQSTFMAGTSTASRGSIFQAQHHGKTELYVNRVSVIREMHCKSAWEAIRAESFETPPMPVVTNDESIPGGKVWPGESKEDNGDGHHYSFETYNNAPPVANSTSKDNDRWKLYWSETTA